MVGGPDYSEVSGWSPPTYVDMGVLGGVNREEAVARPVFGRRETQMVNVRPVLSRD